MEASATYKIRRVSPQKARLVVDLIRGKSVSEALSILPFTKKRVTQRPRKDAAFGDCQRRAESQNILDVDDLVVSRALSTKGRRKKRTSAGADGPGLSLSAADAATSRSWSRSAGVRTA